MLSLYDIPEAAVWKIAAAAFGLPMLLLLLTYPQRRRKVVGGPPPAIVLRCLSFSVRQCS
ncbi:MAG: hypothetical protein WBE48_06065 [Xanthobacteraceae bacterium]